MIEQKRTGKYRYNRFMDCLNLLLLKQIAHEQGCNQENYHDEERP